MVNVKDQKVNTVIQGLHEALLQKIKKDSQVREDIVMENRLFAIICHDFDMGPTKCAIAMNNKYGYDLTSDEVIQIFRNRKVANPQERRELWQWAREVAALFIGAMKGKKESYEKFEKKRKESVRQNSKRHDSQERIVAIMIYEIYPEIDIFKDKSNLHLLGNTFARYFFLDMADVVGEVYSFAQVRQEKKKGADGKQEKQITYEQAIRRIDQLENLLERSNTMLQDLQDEFTEQLEASKVRELADFFARLNSEKYGCILDELLVVRKGIDELRKNNYELPIEINGLLIMVKKLIQFVRDSHIEPIMKTNSIREVIAADVEFCNYEGTPFIVPEEKKKVIVVSPGWIYKDKELQISRPKVKEEM